ncbi:hypothetical protein LGV61_04015 [Desulfurispirillum indicum]|uniref:hypothetical protein n=1 Tax=Desulfurispirillum indicum TaxID=936456 RepID=UPI001CFB4921|nr:hypothetical protein [Desulfurispirillum indicum]UCZ57452.1 hypothetical protein LGV61_04015 [Desulfurispirillum indicum]
MTTQKGHKNAPPEHPFIRLACSPVLEIRQQAAQRGPSAALQGIARHCDVQGVRLAPRFARALHLRTFQLPVCCEVLKDTFFKIIFSEKKISSRKAAENAKKMGSQIS